MEVAVWVGGGVCGEECVGCAAARGIEALIGRGWDQWCDPGDRDIGKGGRSENER